MELSKVAEEAGLALQQRGPVNRFGQGNAEGGETANVARALATRMFEAQEGEIFTAADDAGHLVAKLVEVTRPDPSRDPEALAAVQDSLVNAINGDLLTGFVTALRQDASITVNQALIEQVVTGHGAY